MKFYGPIGYAELTETAPGVWVEQIVERNYFGDLNKVSRRLQSADKVNDDITVSNEISIVADPYAVDHFHNIRYVVFSGAKWKVDAVNVQPPRLILTLGGVYNG